MHEPNFKHRTIWSSDNLNVLRGINAECIDLIYLDPPFNSNKHYKAPIGSKAAGAAFKDTWTLSDVDLAWHGEIADREPALYEVIQAANKIAGKSMMSYLIMMAIRLLEMKRILKPTGSIYLHCDPTASHYLKLLMDTIFGRKNFRNEIIWSYTTGLHSAKKFFPKKHDVIFFYTKTNDYSFENPREDEISDATKKKYKKYLEKDGYTMLFRGIASAPSLHSRLYKSFTKRNGYEPSDTDIAYIFKPALLKTVWNVHPLQNSRMNKEALGYPTQKPLKLLERIIKASSNPGDVVFDPFCGCATTMVAAEKLGRKWAGIDISPLAVNLVRQRMLDEGVKPKEIIARLDIPYRTDFGKLPHYRTHKHVLYGKQEGNCYGCKMHFPFRNFEVDHIIPKKKGGTDHFDNLQLLCGACNRKKGARSQEEFLAEMKELVMN